MEYEWTIYFNGKWLRPSFVALNFVHYFRNSLVFLDIFFLPNIFNIIIRKKCHVNSHPPYKRWLSPWITFRSLSCRFGTKTIQSLFCFYHPVCALTFINKQHPLYSAQLHIKNHYFCVFRQIRIFIFRSSFYKRRPKHGRLVNNALFLR